MKPLFSRELEKGYSLGSGLHFAVVQNALYLSVGLFVNFSLLGYFVVVLSWLLGSVFGLNPVLRQFSQAKVSLVTTSLAAIFIYWLSGNGMVATPATWIVVEAVAIVAGIQAGSFFGMFEESERVAEILWHENNGFILGIILSIFAFADLGVRFLSYAPLVTLTFAHLTTLVPPKKIALAVLGLSAVGIGFGLPSRYLLLGLVATALIYFPDAKPPVVSAEEKRGPAFSRKTLSLLLVGCGFCLILLQTMVVRQFSALLAACEVSILLVSATFLVGYSVAYRLSPYVSLERVARWAPGILAVQIVYLCFGNMIYAAMASGGYSYLAVLWLFLLLSFFSSSLFAIILPLQLGGSVKLSAAYRWELTGSALGVVLCVVGQVLNVSVLLPAFILVAAAITIRISPPKWSVAIGVACSVLLTLIVVKGNRISELNTTTYYASRQKTSVSLLHSSSNFYHQIDVIRTAQGEKHAFLNGVRYFGDYGLNEFTLYLAELPAALTRPEKVLILGAGSLTSIRRVAPFSKNITVVEIDPEVARVSETHFADQNQLDRLSAEGVRYNLVFDDARHFLRTTGETYDLIIFDISAPYYLQTASLHTLEFFSLIRRRLSDHGVFSISTSGVPGNVLGRRLTKTVAKVFPEFQMLSVPQVNGFLYASAKPLPWRTQDVVPQIQKLNGYVPDGTSLFSPDDLKPALASFDPLSLNNMSVLFDDNIRRIRLRIQ